MNFKILQENFKIQKLTGDFSREFQNSKFQKLRENLNFKSCSAPEGPAAPVPGLSSGAQAQLRIQLSKSWESQDSTLKISGFNSQNLGSSVPGLSGAQLSKSQLQGVLQEISPENFEIQKLRENSPENFKIQNPRENFKIQKLRENSPENFKFKISLENSPEDFKFKISLEISPENFKIQNPRENFKIQKLRENSPEDFKFKISLEISPEDFKFKISLEISPENFKIQNPRENFKIQKLRENSPEDFKFKISLEISPENFEISKAAREFQNLLHPSRLNSQKPQDSTLKNFKTQLSKTQERKKNHEIMKFVFCPKQQKNSF